MTYATREASVDDGQPIALHVFALGPTTWRYTSGPATVTVAGNDYEPMAIRHDKLGESLSADKGSFKVTAPRDITPSALFLTTAPAEVVSYTLLLDHYGEGDWQTAWKGRVVGASFTGDNEVEFACENVFSSLKRTGLRRLYQMQCPHALYGTQCGVDKATYAAAYELQSVDGTTLSLVYTAALLPFDGADGSTALTDSTGRAWAAGDGAQLDTAQKKYGTASLLLDGTGDYAYTASHADFDIAGGDFTIEAWVYLTAPSTDRVIFSRRNGSGTAAGYELATDSSGRLTFTAWGAAGAAVVALVGTATALAGSWHHIAVSRAGAAVKLFLNGAVEASGTQSAAPVDAATGPRIGLSTLTASPRALLGWVDDFRFTHGKAHYTGAFTAPVAALTASAPQPDVDYLAGGYCEYTDPTTSATMRLFITTNTLGTVTVATLPFGLAAGSTITAYPGCNRTLAQCASRFANTDNFGGVPYMPKGKNPFGGNRLI